MESHRYPGTVPPDVAVRIEAAIEAGSLIWEEGLAAHSTDSYTILATGFRSHPRRDPLIEELDEAIEAGEVDELPGGEDRQSARAALRGPADLPVPAHDLSVMAGLYVSGPLALLRLGPPAPNIIGAHNAYKRLVPSIQERCCRP